MKLFEIFMSVSLIVICLILIFQHRKIVQLENHIKRYCEGWSELSRQDAGGDAGFQSVYRQPWRLA